MSSTNLPPDASERPGETFDVGPIPTLDEIYRAIRELEAEGVEVRFDGLRSREGQTE